MRSIYLEFNILETIFLDSNLLLFVVVFASRRKFMNVKSNNKNMKKCMQISLV